MQELERCAAAVRFALVQYEEAELERKEAPRGDAVGPTMKAAIWGSNLTGALATYLMAKDGGMAPDKAFDYANREPFRGALLQDFREMQD